jgi:uncharacterized repeat protein (TIGR01451 family)
MTRGQTNADERGAGAARRFGQRLPLWLSAVIAMLPLASQAAPPSGDGDWMVSGTLEVGAAKRGAVAHRSIAKGVLTAPFEGIVVVAGGATHLDTDADGALDAGEVVAYHYTVINTGDLDLSALALSDDFGPVSCPQSTLVPDAHMVCTANHVVTAAEQLDGAVINTVQVSGLSSAGRPVQASDELATRNLQGSAGVRVFKSPRLLTDVDASESVTLGDVVRYTFVIKNDNADTLSAVTLSEPDPSRIDTPITCDATTSSGAVFAGNGTGTLAGTDTVLCRAEYTVRAADVSSGEVANLSEVRATAPGPRTLFATGASLIVVPPPQLALDKQIVSGNPYDAVGDVIQYSYLVSNTGGASLPGPVTVSDNRTAVTCPVLTTVGDGDLVFDAGEQITCSASYVVTQTDIDAGTVTNTATATAGSTSSPPDSATATFVGLPPRIGVSKRVRPISGAPPYLVIFDMRVGNYGPVALSQVQVTENLRQTFPLPVTFTVVSVQVSGTAVANPAFNGIGDTGLLLPAQSSLAPGAMIDIELRLQVSPQGQTGPFFNSVQATGTSPTSQLVTDTSTNGITPDPNQDGVPDEGTPTPLGFPVDVMNIPAGSPASLALLIALAALLAGWHVRRR